MYSTRGRPRQVTDEQVNVILQWQASRKSMGELAKELGLSKATVSYVLQIGGRFKQPSPERRVAEIDRQRANRRRLRKAGWL